MIRRRKRLARAEKDGGRADDLGGEVRASVRQYTTRRAKAANDVAYDS